MSTDSALHKRVSSWLGVSKRVSSVTAVSDESSLARYLGHAECHLVILVLENDKQALPSATLQYPHLRVLAITAELQTVNSELFYQQGATDVVSLHEPAIAQHAISRLIDECVQQLKLQRLQMHCDTLRAEINAMHSKFNDKPRVQSMKASNDHQHDQGDAAQASFQHMVKPVIENIITKSNLRDSATGLPSRKTVLKRFQSMLLSDIKAPRFTALLIHILTDKKTTDQHSTATSNTENSAEKNVMDLTLYRAANALQACVATNSILGRVNQNALLLIQPSDVEPVSRDAANRVRQSLGTLGGLIDADNDLHINTVNFPSSTKISADEVVERLETLTT